MVNNRLNLSAYSGDPPAEGETDRRIAGGPLYPAEAIRGVLARGASAIFPVTDKCSADMQRYSIDAADIIEIIEAALANGRFRRSEWCRCRGGAWAACDGYSVKLRQQAPNSYAEIWFDYYLKFAIGRTGVLILIVSCHLPEDRV
jgi:hypothetical protein